MTYAKLTASLPIYKDPNGRVLEAQDLVFLLSCERARGVKVPRLEDEQGMRAFLAGYFKKYPV